MYLEKKGKKAIIMRYSQKSKCSWNSRFRFLASRAMPENTNSGLVSREVQQPIFWNYALDKGKLKNFVSWFLKAYGEKKTLELLEQLKVLGFGYATEAGISLGIEDLKIPPQKSKMLAKAKSLVDQSRFLSKRGSLTDLERTQSFMQIWNEVNEDLKDEVVAYFKKTNILNPVYMMAFSGARGNLSQVRQLVGMRGLMSDPQGKIIDFPILSNFREGLTLTEYLISTYGARKGIVDTALRTATAGYLTRRLVDVAQHVVVSKLDCGTQRGIFLFDMKDGVKTIYAFQNRLIGRVLAQDIYVDEPCIGSAESSLSKVKDLENKTSESLSLVKRKIASKNTEVNESLAHQISKVTKRALVRSPLTCEQVKRVCQLCYGWSLATSRLVSIGEAVGVIAGQSIGEPGTQLTMRTFHTGGVFAGNITEQINAPFDGTIEYSHPIAGSLLRVCLAKNNSILAFLTKTGGTMILKPSSEQSQENKKEKIYKLPPFALLFARHGEFMAKQSVLAQISGIDVRAAREAREAKTQGSLKKQESDAANGSVSQKETQTSEQTVYTSLEGEIYYSELDLMEEIDPKYGERVSKSEDWAKVWVLAAKIFQNPIPSKLSLKNGKLSTNTKNSNFPQVKDFISKQTPVQEIQWFSPFGSLISFPTNKHRNSDGTLKRLLRADRNLNSTNSSFSFSSLASHETKQWKRANNTQHSLNSLTNFTKTKPGLWYRPSTMIHSNLRGKFLTQKKSGLQLSPTFVSYNFNKEKGLKASIFLKNTQVFLPIFEPGMLKRWLNYKKSSVLNSSSVSSPRVKNKKEQEQKKNIQILANDAIRLPHLKFSGQKNNQRLVLKKKWTQAFSSIALISRRLDTQVNYAQPLILSNRIPFVLKTKSFPFSVSSRYEHKKQSRLLLTQSLRGFVSEKQSEKTPNSEKLELGGSKKPSKEMNSTLSKTTRSLFSHLAEKAEKDKRVRRPFNQECQNIFMKESTLSFPTIHPHYKKLGYGGLVQFSQNKKESFFSYLPLNDLTLNKVVAVKNTNVWQPKSTKGVVWYPSDGEVGDSVICLVNEPGFPMLERPKTKKLKEIWQQNALHRLNLSQSHLIKKTNLSMFLVQQNLKLKRFKGLSGTKRGEKDSQKEKKIQPMNHKNIFSSETTLKFKSQKPGFSLIQGQKGQNDSRSVTQRIEAYSQKPGLKVKRIKNDLKNKVLKVAKKPTEFKKKKNLKKQSEFNALKLRKTNQIFEERLPQLKIILNQNQKRELGFTEIFYVSQKNYELNPYGTELDEHFRKKTHWFYNSKQSLKSSPLNFILANDQGLKKKFDLGKGSGILTLTLNKKYKKQHPSSFSDCILFKRSLRGSILKKSFGFGSLPGRLPMAVGRENFLCLNPEKQYLKLFPFLKTQQQKSLNNSFLTKTATETSTSTGTSQESIRKHNIKSKDFKRIEFNRLRVHFKPGWIYYTFNPTNVLKKKKNIQQLGQSVLDDLYFESQKILCEPLKRTLLPSSNPICSMNLFNRLQQENSGMALATSVEFVPQSAEGAEGTEATKVENIEQNSKPESEKNSSKLSISLRNEDFVTLTNPDLQNNSNGNYKNKKTMKPNEWIQNKKTRFFQVSKNINFQNHQNNRPLSALLETYEISSSEEREVYNMTLAAELRSQDKLEKPLSRTKKTYKEIMNYIGPKARFSPLASMEKRALVVSPDLNVSKTEGNAKRGLFSPGNKGKIGRAYLIRPFESKQVQSVQEKKTRLYEQMKKTEQRQSGSSYQLYRNFWNQSVNPQKNETMFLGVCPKLDLELQPVPVFQTGMNLSPSKIKKGRKKSTNATQAKKSKAVDQTLRKKSLPTPGTYDYKGSTRAKETKGTKGNLAFVLKGKKHKKLKGYKKVHFPTYASNRSLNLFPYVLSYKLEKPEWKGYTVSNVSWKNESNKLFFRKPKTRKQLVFIQNALKCMLQAAKNKLQPPSKTFESSNLFEFKTNKSWAKNQISSRTTAEALGQAGQGAHLKKSSDSLDGLKKLDQWKNISHYFYNVPKFEFGVKMHYNFFLNARLRSSGHWKHVLEESFKHDEFRNDFGYEKHNFENFRIQRLLKKKNSDSPLSISIHSNVQTEALTKSGVLSNHSQNNQSYSRKGRTVSQQLPISKNFLNLDKNQTFQKEKPVGFTRFYSPFEGLILKDYSQCKSEDLKKTFNLHLDDVLLQERQGQKLILTKEDVFSLNFPSETNKLDQYPPNRKVTRERFNSWNEKQGFFNKISKQQVFEKILENHAKFQQVESGSIEKSQRESYTISNLQTTYEDKNYTLNQVHFQPAQEQSKFRIGKFAYAGDSLYGDFCLPRAGQVIHVNSQKVTFRKAEYFSLLPRAILHAYNGHSILPNNPVMTLPFETLNSGDIVQGIPKVEQYLEARTTIQGRLFLNSLPVLLYAIYKRYLGTLEMDKAVRQSLLKIQQILVDGVQRVYRSQGVGITDKHLEVIVRQMTSKVKIIYGGQTGFFPGELVDLELVERVNKSLVVKVVYEPVVLGITRASLEVDSFLSAASFQQTTKVLTRAALENKRDFLKGLKENLLVGNLLPAGTGYVVPSTIS